MARAERVPMSKTWRRVEPPPSRHLLGAGLGLYMLRAVPLVGRQSERDQLWSCLGQVHEDGRPRAAIVRGASGVGKTRLVEWFAERAHELGAAEMIEATHGAIPGPNDGVVAAIRRHSQTGGLGRDDRLERLYVQLSDDGRHKQIDGLAWRLLAELTGPGEPTVRVEDRVYAQARYLAAIGRERPVIVWVDDSQWAPDALRMCERMIEEGQPARVLFVLTVRDDALAERPLETRRLEAIAGHRNTREIRLAALPATDHEALVARLVGLSGDLAHRVAERTMGNPLFAVQLVGDWVERGVLEVGDEGFRLVEGDAAPLPDGLHAVWSDRVGRVLERLPDPEGARVALEVAAALGHVLDEEEWRAVCRRRGLEPPRQLGRALQRARLAWPRHGDHAYGWGFVHSMLRESLLRTAREAGRSSDHHRACAEELAARDGGGDHHERIAEHWLGAGERGAALRPLLVAAELHSKRGDFDRALAIDDRRSRLVEELGLPPSDPRSLLGECRRIRTMCIRGDYDTAKEGIQRVTEAARELDDAATLAELRWTQGVYARHDDDPEGGVRWVEDALARFAELGDTWGVARCHKKLGELSRIAGKLDDAARHYGTAMEVFEGLGDPYEIAWSAMGLCATERQRGDLDAAVRWAQRGLTTFERIGGHLGIGHALNELGEIARYRGDFDTATKRYRRVLDVWGAQPHRDLDLIRYNLARALLGRGDVEEARALLLDLQQGAGGGQRPGLILYVTAGLCEATATAEDWSACERHLEAVTPMFDEVPLVDLDLATSMQRAGELAVEAGREELSEALLSLAIRQHRALGDEATADALAGRESATH
jgi:tetratricopeptide (TPR) repeat protein